MKMIATSSIAAVAGLILALPAAAEPAFQTANECSTENAKRYAMSNCETSAAILEAAFEKCRDKWEFRAEAAASEAEAKPEFYAALDDAVKMGTKSSSGNKQFDRIDVSTTVQQHHVRYVKGTVQACATYTCL